MFNDRKPEIVKFLLVLATLILFSAFQNHTAEAASVYRIVTITDDKLTKSTADDTHLKLMVKNGGKISAAQWNRISAWVKDTSLATFQKMKKTDTGRGSCYYFGYRRNVLSSLKSRVIKSNIEVKVRYTRRYVEDYVKMAYYISKDKRVGYQTPSGRFFQYNSSGYSWNVDCASFVFYSLYYAGYLRANPKDPFGTDDEGKILKANGFTEVPLSSRKRGDILLVTRKERGSGYGHTAIYCGNNILIDAATNYDGRPGDSSGKEVAMRYYTNGKYRHCYRLTNTSKVRSPIRTPYALRSTQSAQQATIKKK